LARIRDDARHGDYPNVLTVVADALSSDAGEAFRPRRWGARGRERRGGLVR